MKLLELANNRYVIVQDDYLRAVELFTDEVFTEGTSEQILEGKWYGWYVPTTDKVKEYQDAKVLRQATKIKAIDKYIKNHKLKERK